jgi:hypothetical protein
MTQALYAHMNNKKVKIKKKKKKSGVFYTHHASQVAGGTFQVLKNPMWLMTPLQNSIDFWL